MGDTGYLDADGRLWFCGRKAHVVPARGVRLYTECVEPIFNTVPGVSRTALVGIGADYLKTPVIIVELESGRLPAAAESERLVQQLRARAQEFPHTSAIAHFLFHPSLPVDVRHNVKINREVLAVWAAEELANG
jgi:acyl-coenzyme A synthetase/AMP-(fatty) acid ligase